MPRWLLCVSLGLLLLASGCTGQLGDGFVTPTYGAPPTFDPDRETRHFDPLASFENQSFSGSCDPDAAPSRRPLIHLTRRELSATVGSVVQTLVGDAAAESVLNSVSPIVDRLPSDSTPADHGVFPNAETVVQASFIEGTLPVARALGQELSRDPSALLGPCGAAVDEACVRAFLEEDARVIFRRPLRADDVEHYLETFRQGGLSHALAALFMAPQFLFHTEYANGVPDASFALDDYELASRLSYALWGTGPDSPLLDAAASGSLATPEGFRAEAERLFFDPRAEDNLRHFVDEWLHLDDVPLVDLSEPRASIQWETASYAPSDVDAAQLRQEVIDEVRDFVLHHVYDAAPEDRRFSRLFDSRVSSAGDLLSQTIYDESPNRDADGFYELSAPERRGILGRAAYQMIDGQNRRPIMKGVRLLDRIICRELPPPADNATPPEAMLENSFTTRERTAAITEIEGTECAGCHAVINPLGFAMERFDAFGRLADVEHVLAPDDATPMDFVAERPVDSQSRITVAGEAIEVTGPAELSGALGESFEAHQCFARFWWRYINRRREVAEADACQLEAIYRHLEAEDGLAEAMLGGVVHESFRTR